MIEDNPPNVPAEPAPDEITELSQRRTLPPMDVVDAHMVALSLSSMATTLETIQNSVACIPALANDVRILERQHDSALRVIGDNRAAINLAGNMAGRALEELDSLRGICERIETAVGQLARSVQGLDERSKSLYQSVFPERPSDPDFAEVVPINRSRHVMTGD